MRGGLLLVPRGTRLTLAGGNSRRVPVGFCPGLGSLFRLLLSGLLAPRRRDPSLAFPECPKRLFGGAHQGGAISAPWQALRSLGGSFLPSLADWDVGNPTCGGLRGRVGFISYSFPSPVLSGGIRDGGCEINPPLFSSYVSLRRPFGSGIGTGVRGLLPASGREEKAFSSPLLFSSTYGKRGGFGGSAP